MSVCQCALAAVFALGGGGSCRVDRYDVRVMRYEVGALGWVSAAFVVWVDFGGCGFLPEDRWRGGEVGGEGVEREGGGDVGEGGHAAEAFGEGVGAHGKKPVFTEIS